MLKIRSVRGGSARMNEEDRIQLASLLIKAGYNVRIGYGDVPGKKTKEYYVEYFEQEDKHDS